ncbi:pyridoxal 5'-phosphate synthase subunit PdxT [Leptolinea sp. HRD-7]|nr:pyridoxal 5'-phosphate synthase subunit PdxT [Leptolinea sp. HRD-7]
MKIGVLALQGDFAEHQTTLQKLGIDTIQVRLPGDLDGLNGLIIPGGESTTIGKLAVAFNLMEPLKEFAKEHAIWGTCAGAIFLSKDARRPQPLLGVMDIVVERNAFGRQVDSFEIDLDIPALRSVDPEGHPYHAVFIRAPLIQEAHAPAEVLCKLPENILNGGGRIVAARQGRLMATSFHPELTEDDRFHRYFLELAK